MAGHRGDVAVVWAGLESEDGAVREAAVSGLARLGLLDVVTVRRGLSDTELGVVRRTIECVASRSSAGLLDDSIDDALVGILRGPDPVLAEVAAWAFGERHQEAERVSAVVLDALIDATRAHDDALVREAAVAALGSIGDDRGRETVVHAMSDKATVRRRAVIALAAFEGDDVNHALHAARTDRDWQVRQAAEDLTTE